MFKIRFRRRRQTTRAGNSLLEVIAASTILAMALVPALRLMRQSLEIGRDLETANMLATYCTSKLEEELAQTSIDWQNASHQGDFASDGNADIRFTVVRTDSVSAGGINGQLMSITVTVYHDVNSNNSLSTGEPQVTFATKLSRNDAYLNL